MKGTINQRLIEWINYKEITQADLSRQLIIKGRSQVNQWCKGTAPIPDGYILKILRLFDDLPARWFLFGKGKMTDTHKNSNESGAKMNDFQIECQGCISKKNEIDTLNIAIRAKDGELAAKEELLEMYRGKKENPIKNSA